MAEVLFCAKPTIQAVLDEQRGVVQNEKRQGENQPYSKIWRELLANLFPENHPYSWETIGSMADLEAASLEEMQMAMTAGIPPRFGSLAGSPDEEAGRSRPAHRG